MASNATGLQQAAGSELQICQRLERGEVVYFASCPFPLVTGDDHRFLLEQRLGRGHKNISYLPQTDRAGGFHHMDAAQAERLRGLLSSFAATATRWLSSTLPRYAAMWQPDQVSYRPVEESTRRLRLKSRNDLLHVDAFPRRPTQGWRILRLFANINPSEPRVWATTDPFAKLLEKYGRKVGLPTRQTSWTTAVRRQVLGLFNKKLRQRSVYDQFMLRFHDFLKTNEEFQDRCPKRIWQFAPGSAWMCMTDTASHAALRGRYALEHSYFISPQSLVLPEESPPALLERACGMPVLHRAA